MDNSVTDLPLPPATNENNGTPVTNGNYVLPKKVAVLYSYAKPEFFKTEALYITEREAEHDAGVIKSYLEKMGVEVGLFAGDENLIENVKAYAPEMIFNLVESVRGSDYYASTVPGILDFLNIPYTGTDFFGYAFGTDKAMVKNTLKQFGIPMPNYQLFLNYNDPINIDLRFPLISKLNEIHGGVEITLDSISENEKHLRDRLKYLMTTYRQPVIVEEYIAGREITVFVLEGINRKVYMGEKIFNKPNQKYLFATFEDQWTWDGTTPEPYTYAKYDDPVLREYVKKAFDVAKMIDYGKFDVRMDLSGRYFFIDANSNPAFGPKELSTAMGLILDLYGISFSDMLKRLMVNTLRGTGSIEDLPGGSS